MKGIRNIWLTPLFFTTGSAAVFLCAFGFAFPVLFRIGQAIIAVLALVSVADLFFLFRKEVHIEAQRILPNILGLGDEIEVHIKIQYAGNLPLRAEIIDELPEQVQERNFHIQTELSKGLNSLKYPFRSINRGVYAFRNLNIIIEGPLHFVRRRIVLDLKNDVPVYPSIQQMHENELLAFSRITAGMGSKRYRRIGQSYEFEQIAPFVEGDDYRNINWKASGKTRELMVNQYQDERSQNLYCILSKGRAMKMAFRNMTYLDYAINATLAISNVALKKYDKVGLITFSNKIGSALRAENRRGQIRKILESLYYENERDLEPDFELLFQSIDRLAKNRSLILLFANFETSGMAERAMPLLKKISRKHLLVMILFKDSELEESAGLPKNSVEEIYRVTLAQRQLSEREEIASKLRRQGIHTVVSTPEELSVDVINKYLELKSRGII